MTEQMSREPEGSKMWTSFEEVLRLQNSYSKDNTASMSKRGVVVRNEIPSFLRENSEVFAEPLAEVSKDLKVKGSDGAGWKSLVPWVRIFDPERSPKASVGWYIVYLVHARGEGFWLCIGHGSTRPSNGSPRPDSELLELVNWAQEKLTNVISDQDLIQEKIDLGADPSFGKARDLAKSYEKAVAVGRWYSINQPVSDSMLLADLRVFSQYLKVIYSGEDAGASPDEPHFQASQLQSAIRSIESGGATDSGQGRRNNPEEKLAIELRAMTVATEHFESLGFKVLDTSKGHSFDLTITDANKKKCIVEVKGTVTLGKSIILTRNEVEAHLEAFPNNALAIVHSIELLKDAETPLAVGGTLKIFMPWQIVESELKPLTYQLDKFHEG